MSQGTQKEIAVCQYFSWDPQRAVDKLRVSLDVKKKKKKEKVKTQGLITGEQGHKSQEGVAISVIRGMQVLPAGGGVGCYPCTLKEKVLTEVA